MAGSAAREAHFTAHRIGALAGIRHGPIPDALACRQRLAVPPHHDGVAQRRHQVIALFDDLEIFIAVVIAELGRWMCQNPWVSEEIRP